MQKEIGQKLTAAPVYMLNTNTLGSFYQIYQKFDMSAEMADLYLKNSDGIADKITLTNCFIGKAAIKRYFKSC
jgi:hypothetical protein